MQSSNSDLGECLARGRTCQNISKLGCQSYKMAWPCRAGDVHNDWSRDRLAPTAPNQAVPSRWLSLALCRIHSGPAAGGVRVTSSMRTRRPDDQPRSVQTQTCLVGQVMQAEPVVSHDDVTIHVETVNQVFSWRSPSCSSTVTKPNVGRADPWA
jgi:hypothetical protein